MTESSDLDLAKRCAGGEEEAWTELVRRTEPYLLHVLRSEFFRPNQPSLPFAVEDALQDAYRYLLRNEARPLQRYDGRIPLRSYLKLIVIRRTLKRLNRKDVSPSPSLESVPSPADDGPPLLEHLSMREEISRLRQALRRLPSREQLVLRWIRWEGLSHEQVGRMLGITPAGVGMILQRAQKRLAQVLR